MMKLVQDFFFFFFFFLVNWYLHCRSEAVLMLDVVEVQTRSKVISRNRPSLTVFYEMHNGIHIYSLCMFCRYAVTHFLRNATVCNLLSMANMPWAKLCSEFTSACICPRGNKSWAGAATFWRPMWFLGTLSFSLPFLQSCCNETRSLILFCHSIAPLFHKPTFAHFFFRLFPFLKLIPVCERLSFHHKIMSMEWT